MGKELHILDSKYYSRLIIETEGGTKIAEITPHNATAINGYVIRLKPSED